MSESWFCKWRDRPPTPRQVRRAELDSAVKASFDDSGGTPGTNGSPRVFEDLIEAGWVAKNIDTVNALADRQIGFRSLTESIDTTSGGKLVFHIFGALAEFERELIRERAQVGLAAARARGRVGGRPTVMTPDKIATAQEMYESKEYTIAAIAEVVGVSRASIYRHFDPSAGR